MIVDRKSTFALLALLTLGMAGAAWAAGGSYDEEDPFRERGLIERFQRLGGDLARSAGPVLEVHGRRDGLPQVVAPI